MSAASNYLETALFNAVLRNSAFTSPATVYLALFTTDPTDAASGTEVSGGSYARVAITFAAPSNGIGSNSADVNFTTATGNWGTVTHWGIFDASSAGNLLVHGSMTASLAVNNGQTARVLSGQLTVTVA